MYRSRGDHVNDPDAPTRPSPISCDWSYRQRNRPECGTEFKTGEGNLCSCGTEDLYDGTLASRKNFTRPTAELVTSNGGIGTSEAYRRRLRRNSLKICVGRVRTRVDYASAESVFRLLKRGLVNRRVFRTRQEATDKTYQY